MANPQEFSHITVTADDDDDVVIQAGAVDAAGDAEAEVDKTVVEDADGAPEAFAEGVVESDSAPDAPEAADAEAHPASQARANDAGYHETTLDDLESTKMSTTQKVIIVLAVLGVIAFAAWYLLAR